MRHGNWVDEFITSANKTAPNRCRAPPHVKVEDGLISWDRTPCRFLLILISLLPMFLDDALQAFAQLQQLYRDKWPPLAANLRMQRKSTSSAPLRLFCPFDRGSFY